MLHLTEMIRERKQGEVSQVKFQGKMERKENHCFFFYSWILYTQKLGFQATGE